MREFHDVDIVVGLLEEGVPVGEEIDGGDVPGIQIRLFLRVQGGCDTRLPCFYRANDVCAIVAETN